MQEICANIAIFTKFFCVQILLLYSRTSSIPKFSCRENVRGPISCFTVISGYAEVTRCLTMFLRYLTIYLRCFISFFNEFTLGFYTDMPGITKRFDAHHEKTDLKVFLVVIPKAGWAQPRTPILLLV